MQSLIIVTLAVGIVAASAQSCPLALTQFVTRRAAKGGLLEAAQNADSSYTGLGSYPSVSLARTTLPPCGVRQMHIHQNVDELIYLLDGYISAYTAWGNGTICEQAELEPENSFVYPRNLVHGARNLDCDNNATYLAFFTAFDNALVNVAASAYNMPGGPFANYADPKFKPSLTAATDVTTLAFDPECLAYCTLGVKGGQQPGPSAGGKTRRSFKRL